MKRHASSSQQQSEGLAQNSTANPDNFEVSVRSSILIALLNGITVRQLRKMEQGLRASRRPSVHPVRGKETEMQPHADK